MRALLCAVCYVRLAARMARKLRHRDYVRLKGDIVSRAGAAEIDVLTPCAAGPRLSIIAETAPRITALNPGPGQAVSPLQAAWRRSAPAPRCRPRRHPCPA